MSSLPPLTPVVPVEAATPQMTANTQSNDNGKSFAKVLDAAKTSESSKTDSTPAADKADRVATDKPVAENADDKVAAEKPVDSDTPQVDEATEQMADTATAVVEAAVVAANAIETALATTPAVAVNATLVAAEVQVTTEVQAAPVVAAPVAATAPVVTPETPDATAVTAAPIVTAPVTDETVVATPTTDTPDTAVPVVDSESPDVPVATTPVATDTTQLVDEGTDSLLSALSKTVEVAAATGEVKTDNPAAVSTEHATRNVIDALSPKSNANPIVNAPAISGANPADIPPPVRQLVNLVSPLRQHGDGDYKLLLQLHPEHLGRVEVAVSLNAGQISMQLSSDNAASRQMLREQMNELRASLSSAGLETGSLDVSNQGFQQHTNDTQSGQNSHVGTTVADSDDDEFFSRLATVVNPPATDGQLDAYV